MEKVIKNKKIVRELIIEVFNMFPKDDQIETQFIMDDERGTYVISAVGWFPRGFRELNMFVYINVKEDGKIWIQHDGTDLVLAELLAEKGVPKKEIVLAYQTPRRRKLLPEFAMD